MFIPLISSVNFQPAEVVPDNVLLKQFLHTIVLPHQPCYFQLVSFQRGALIFQPLGVVVRVKHVAGRLCIKI